MGTSRVFDTIDALVAAFRGAGLTVWDGPLVTGDYKPAVHVGYDGDPEGDYMAADPNQEWSGSVGTKAREEEFDIKCAATALFGDSDPKLARDAVKVMLATVENTLRADPSLGQTPTPYVAAYKPGPLYVEPASAGYQVRGVFNVHVKTRLYTA
jgi:hypothetical protein